jgi:ABC-2 type transport system permease protein
MDRSLFHNQLFQMITVYFKEMIREPGVLFWGIAFPILMSLGLGFAFTKKIDITRKVAIVGQDAGTAITYTTTIKIDQFLSLQGIKHKNPGSGNPDYELLIPDDKMGNTTVQFYNTSWQEAMVMLKRGSISLVMTEDKQMIRYHFDPLNPDAQLTYLKLSKQLGGEAIKIEKQNESIEPLTVTGTRYIDFLVPGLIAMGVMMSCMWGLSYGMIDKRSKKLLRRMVATPMRKSYFLFALITVRVAMNVIESLLLLLFAWLVFGITIQGSIPALLLIFSAGNMAFAGIAVFISSHTSNTEIGNGLINAIVMPMMVLSGVFFSYHNFPDWSIPVIQKLPLTLLADGMRSIFIEGAGFSEIIVHFLIMVATGLVFFMAGMRIFKWH